MMNDISIISLDLIDDPKLAMREDINDDEIQSLIASIKQVGLLEPIVVRKSGERYELIAGHRRTTALRRIGSPVVQAKVLDIDDKASLVVRMHENAHRESVNPVDEAVYIARVMTELEYSVSDIAEKLNRSPKYISDRLSILTFPDYLIQAVNDKTISISAALILNRISDDVTRRNFVEYASKDGITVERANAWLSMVNIGTINSNTTLDQIEAMEQPEQHSETYIKCQKCAGMGPIRDLLTVWIHRACPEENITA